MPRSLSLLLFVTGVLPTAAHSQTVGDSGVFVVRHANDTVATEKFTRSETTLEGTLFVRNAAATSQRYKAVLAPDGSVPLIEVTVKEGADTGKSKARVVSQSRVIFREDSAAVDEANNRGLRTFVFGTKRGAIPYLNLSFALLEQAVRQARTHGPPMEVPLFNLGGGQTTNGEVASIGSDSVSVAIGAVEFHLRVDAKGHVLGGRIPGQDVVAERVGGVGGS
jgi:hypothetical protein